MRDGSPQPGQSSHVLHITTGSLQLLSTGGRGGGSRGGTDSVNRYLPLPPSKPLPHHADSLYCLDGVEEESRRGLERGGQ